MINVVAFYLPQFHPIPENDEWWGKGFTEWTNLAKARPLFVGHYQPHVPSDLGFYDLRVPETRIAQAELARRYGITGFCYYEYWFGGRRLLDRPFNEVLSSGQPDFPFCICWANETWTGIWHGAADRILIEQVYPGMEDHRRHFESWLKAFSDPRYIRISGEPLLLVYKPRLIPEVVKVTDFWRELAVKAGLKGLHLVGVDYSFKWNPRRDGFDAAVSVNMPMRQHPWVTWASPVRRIKRIYRVRRQIPPVYEYRDLVPSFLLPAKPGIKTYPCVLPNWDNTPRSGANGLVLHGSTPELFRQHFRLALDYVKDSSADTPLVFVKSWNEWAEGNHLEPDLRFGTGYLQVINEELQDAKNRSWRCDESAFG
jgi:lipopolysaccharide biosynthesis protein